MDTPMQRSQLSRHNSLTRALIILAAIVVGILFFAPAPLDAKGPSNPHTVLSNRGARWNAAHSDVNSFSSFVATAAPLNQSEDAAEAAQPARLLAPRNPGSVIGADNRTRVQDIGAFPFRAIAFVQTEFPGGFYLECTGFLIGEHTVATAGHCVYSPGLGWAHAARVMPAVNGAVQTFGAATGNEFFAVAGWVNNMEPEYDYGAIQLNQDIGKKTGWLGMANLDNSMLDRAAVSVTGYPADHPYRTMWTMTSSLRRVTATRLYYNIDTYAGQSGSPVYNARFTRACGYCVVGIHGYGTAADPRGKLNSGVRMTSAVLDNFIAWRNMP